MSLTNVLAIPQLYQAVQEMGGFHWGRLHALQKYLSPKAGERVIDIGCGPGYVARDLPDQIDYLGFDIDERYIAFANRRFAKRGRFFCRPFDEAAAKTFAPADIVLMHGVLHHVSDEDAAGVLSAVANVLRPGGALFTVDPAYKEGQSWYLRFLMNHDRGRFTRTPEQYVQLLAGSFASVESHTHEDLARIRYTLFVGISRKSA